MCTHVTRYSGNITGILGIFVVYLRNVEGVNSAAEIGNLNINRESNGNSMIEAIYRAEQSGTSLRFTESI